MIKIHNDGKEKSGSWEARFDLDFANINIVGGISDASATSYGDTEEEAVDNLKINLGKMIESIQNVDTDKRVYVAWNGVPLEDYKLT